MSDYKADPEQLVKLNDQLKVAKARLRQIEVVHKDLSDALKKAQEYCKRIEEQIEIEKNGKESPLDQ